MATPNEEYWARRMEKTNSALLDRGFSYVQNLDEQFDRAIASIEKDTAAWYQRFATNNGISYTEARKWLTTSELKEFRWTVEEYIKRAEESALDSRWIKELENASARVHISRLEAHKVQLQQQAELLHGGQLDALDAHLRRTYLDRYYTTAFELQRGIGLGWTVHDLGTNVIERVLARPWTADAQTFSDRVWTNKQALVNSVNTHFTQMIIRGEAPQKTIAAIARDMNVSKAKAGRLVMTESAYFSAAAQKDCFNSLGVEEYVIVATLDSSTSELCRDMDGKVFKMSEYTEGLTAPPFHPWCRTATAPYFADMQELGERARRDPDTGGTVTDVPRSMTYHDWKSKFVHSSDGATDDNGRLTRRASSSKIGDTDGYTTIDAIRQIDFNDKDAIKHEIDAFGAKHRASSKEHAVVISREGKIYELSGTSISVNPEIVGIEELKGSIGAHNHPVSLGCNKGDSFSREDLLFSARHQTGIEYLFSGERQDAFLYAGNLSDDDLYTAYKKAKDNVLSRAWENETEIEWEQADVLRELAKILEGLTFYENIR